MAGFEGHLGRSMQQVYVDTAALEGADVICFFAPSQVEAFRELDVETHAKYCAHGQTTLEAMSGLEPVIDTDELFGS